MISSDFRTEARRKLSGKWGKVACITLAYMAIFFLINLLKDLFSDSAEWFFSLVTTIIEIPLSFGMIISFMKLYNGEDVKVFDFFTLGFSNFAKSWKISLHIFLKMLVPIILIVVSCVFIGIGSLVISEIALYTSTSLNNLAWLAIVEFILFIVSLIWSITKYYYYQMAYYIAVDNEDMTAKETVEKSRELMTGNRAKLFWLELSFIGWAILSIFTLGIAYLWLTPYVLFATIAFYNFVSDNKSNVETEVVTENNDNPIKGE